jgi:dihydroorotate dehydrogenase (NAD+) catalytic subunit
MVKGTTLLPRPGNNGQRAVETPAGMLNCIGLENPGVDYFLAETLPKLREYDTQVIVNISGATEEEYARLAEKLTVPGVAALELNISCPNVKQGGIVFGTCPESAAGVVRAVKQATDKLVITKLSPNVTDIVGMAKAAEEAGSDILSLINTLIGMKIDIVRRRPVLGNVIGGLSGPAVRPVAVRMVYQVAQAVKVPIIGMGGIITVEDALEFILAGASAVAIGTGNFVEPELAERLADELSAYLDKTGAASVAELVGAALPKKAN